MTATEDMRIDWAVTDTRREISEAHDAASEAAAKRVAFQLTYARATNPRTVNYDAIDGDPIPNAYGSGMQLNEWYDGDQPTEPTVDAWIDKYAHMAISEAVHEALEWFRVDGKPWIDPHAHLERAVQEEVREMCTRLAELRRTTPNDVCTDPSRRT